MVGSVIEFAHGSLKNCDLRSVQKQQMKNPIDTYSQNLAQQKLRYAQIKSKFNSISAARLVVGIAILIFGYYFFKTTSPLFAALALASIAGFIVLIKIHGRLSSRRKLNKALIEINENELSFLNGEKIPFPDGLQFVDPTHAYSYDLDFFGPRSLFHVLNRTTTYIGSKTLAKTLSTLLPPSQILENQPAIEELANDVAWRQELQSLGMVTADRQQIYQDLQTWTKTTPQKQTKFIHVISYVLPAILIGLMVYNYIFDAGLGNLCVLLFLTNLGILGNQLKMIKQELTGSTKIDETLQNYSLMLQKIETKEFTSEKLKNLKSQLVYPSGSASIQIEKLSKLFGQLENILNPVGTVLFNGFLLFHLHTLRGFRNWKFNFAEKTMNWIDLIGEMEALNSLANFAYNNPAFTFPELNDKHEIVFEKLGHPLLNAQKRVTSDIEFTKQKFIILTGSNMSGKSTFLRSLGVNMVLAGTGAPVCAQRASIHPIPVYVSMRVSDSLNDSESFFFAEVKRLKEVMDAAEKETCFVLLDEILRGTNSDDKRTGTVEVVKKIIAKNAIGAVATHDLKVCDTTAEYPDQLMNKCFEVEIVDNELYFDYQLRDGVCKNKSATFLMKKMGVI